MMRRIFRADAGTSMVEFSLLAPVMVFLLIGLIEIGRYAFYAILAANAARAGVQYGAQNLNSAQDVAGMRNAVIADGQNFTQWSNPGGINPSHFCVQNGTIVTCPIAPATPAPGTVYYVKVAVSGRFTGLLNYPGIPHTLPVSGSAVMRVEQQ